MRALLLSLPLTVLVLTSCANLSEQPTATRLDIPQYAGKWHEIARLPNRFERNIVAATATYAALPDGNLSVRNDGLKANGKRTSIQGKVTQPSSEQPGRLKVRFNTFPANLFAGDYWILGLTEDHAQALIGTPTKNYLWLLSKDPTDRKEDFPLFLKTAKELGYDTSQLYWNPKRLTGS